MSNSMSDIKRFLSTSEKPVTNQEAIEFWQDLSDEEKDYYRNVDLDALKNK